MSGPDVEADTGPEGGMMDSSFEPDDAIGRDGKTVAERAAEPIIDGPEPPDVLDNPSYYARAFARAEAEREAEAG